MGGAIGDVFFIIIQLLSVIIDHLRFVNPSTYFFFLTDGTCIHTPVTILNTQQTTRCFFS